MGAVPKYDESQWPVVVITPPSVQVTDKAFESHLNVISSYFRRGEPFGLVIVMLDAPLLPAEQRRMTAEQIERDTSAHGALCVATALVATSATHRGVLNVLGWLSGRRLNNQAFATVEQAIKWVQSEVYRASKLAAVTAHGKKRDAG